MSWWNIPLNRGGANTLPNPDNDNDGIPDDTDPDDDNDGMTDVYEAANGLNQFANDAAGDLDEDGLSNYGEFIAGTAANNPNSVFRVRRTQLQPGNVLITWTSVAGKTYEVHSSGQAAGPYTFFSTVPSTGNVETSALIPRSAAQRFFVIRVLP